MGKNSSPNWKKFKLLLWGTGPRQKNYSDWTYGVYHLASNEGLYFGLGSVLNNLDPSLCRAEDMKSLHLDMLEELKNITSKK